VLERCAVHVSLGTPLDRRIVGLGRIVMGVGWKGVVGR